MKKLFFMSAVLLSSMCLSAQTVETYVSELSFTPVSFLMDTLRANNEDPKQLLLEVQYLQGQVEKDAENIKLAQAQAKEERSLIELLQGTIKESRKSMDASEKLTTAQIKEFEKVMGMLDKQIGHVHKTMRVSKETRHYVENSLEAEKKSIQAEQSELNNHLRDIANIRKGWDAQENLFVACLAELDKKELTLKNWADTNKYQSEMLKNEVKLAKDLIKAAKK